MSASPESVGVSQPPRPKRAPTVEAVLAAGKAGDGDARAWHGFLSRYSRLLLYVTARFGHTYDARMDLYTHLITELRRDDHRRLRAYSPQSGAQFSTWLLVVARRLCVDYVRKRYGRGNGDSEEGIVRRRLEDLVCVELDPELFVDQLSPSPETIARRSELCGHLTEVMERMHPRDRLLLNLRFVDDRNASDIASALGFSSIWQVYRRTDALLKQVRQELEARGVHDATP